jgi:carboxyl-terminal processing protease
MNKNGLLALLITIGLGTVVSFRMNADKHNLMVINEMEPNITGELFTPSNAPAHVNQSVQQTIMQVLQEGHYSPKPLNDSFSRQAFDRYIEYSDYGKLFFTQTDYNEFSLFRYKIDDQILQNETTLYNLVSKRLQERINEANTFYQEALKNPFSFNEKDEIELDGKKIQWAQNTESLKARWMQSIKYRTLVRFNELKEQQDKQKENAKKEIKSTIKNEVLKSDAELEIDARESVRKNMQGYFKRINKITETDRFATYINSLCRVVDPHTDYFPPKDKQRFDEEMSGSFFGIGAQLAIEEGQCKIKQVIVGAPAWKEGRMKVEDIILKVAQGSEDPVEVSGWDIEDIVQIIRGKEGTEVRLTVKHVAGDQEIIAIRRGKVETESTFAKSVIIQQQGKKIGYILLPEFYNAFNDPNGRRCAEDVKKEILKLNEEKIDGIVFDLRNNGGGSLSDVVDIVGFFIDRGPVVQVKARGSAAQALNDSKAGALYDGPLAILINQGSASASEIMAAAIQDYNRGIILGSTSFGKGTVQRIFGLDEFYRGDPTLQPPGSLKLTLQKFYRINGGSTQLKGVTPDIPLPDAFSQMNFGERKDEYSLPWDQVAKAEYKTLNMGVDFNLLVARSNQRIINSAAFNVIKKNATRIKQQMEDNRYSLNLSKFRDQMKESKELAKQLEDINQSKETVIASNLKADLMNIKTDSISVKRNEEWLKIIRKDAYINEAANVLIDWNASKK